MVYTTLRNVKESYDQLDIVLHKKEIFFINLGRVSFFAEYYEP